MNSVITLATTRTHYSAHAAAKATMTVRDLIQALEMFDEDTPVVFSNDNGYTYGIIEENLLNETDVEEED